VIVCIGSGDQGCQEFGRREHLPAAVVYTRSLWAAPRWALCGTTRVSLEGAGRNFVGVGNSAAVLPVYRAQELRFGSSLTRCLDHQ